jgi:MscS family membrane protein
MRFLALFSLLILSAPPAMANIPSCGNAQEAVLTLLDLLQAGGTWSPAQAGSCLEMPADEKDLAGKRAVQLKQILDAKGLMIDTKNLPTDADYSNSQGKHSVQLHALAPRITVEKVGDQWLFPTATVTQIPKMYSETFSGASQTLRNLLPPPFHKPLAFDLQGWQLVLFGLLIFASWGAGRLAHKVLTGQILKVTKKLRITISEDIIERAQGPITWAATGAVFLYGIADLQFGVRLSEGLHTIARVVLSISIVLIVMRLVDVLTGLWAAKAANTDTKMDDQLIPLANRGAKIIVAALGILFVLQNLGIDVTSLLAGVTISGLAIALAAKDTVENLFGSAMIFIDRPFQIGDTIDIDGTIGTVEEVGFRSTRLRTPVGSLVSVPNGKIANAKVDNLGARSKRRLRITLGFTYDASRDQLQEFVDQVRALFEAEPLIDAGYEVHFVNFGDSALEVMLHGFLLVPGWSDELQAKQRIYMEVWGIAEKLDLSFAFPSQSLYIESVPATHSS